MSKYKPTYVTHDNNPEKKVPDDLIEKFFLVVKNANINEIREFVINNKFKFSSMYEKKTGKTPFHVVLELDEKVADERTKLELLKYLADNGAPTDAPDSSNIRPIHLAAQLQDLDIIDFMTGKETPNLDLDPSNTDFANNSALHWAVRGNEIACPTISPGPGSLVPSQPIEKQDLSIDYTDVTGQIMKLLSEGPGTDDLIHIINTIMEIPKMYSNTDEEENIQTRLVKIFTDVGVDPTYSGGLVKQQMEIDQLVDTVVEKIQNDLMPSAKNELDIRANNTGWGPQLPVKGQPIADAKDNDLTKILPLDRAEEINKMEVDLTDTKNNIYKKNVGISEIIDKQKTFDDIYRYIDALVFGGIRDNDGNIFGKKLSDAYFGSEITRMKLLFLFMFNYLMENGGKIFADIVMNDSIFLSTSQYRYIRETKYDNTVPSYKVTAPIQLPNSFKLLGSNFTQIFAYNWKERHPLGRIIKSIMGPPNSRSQDDHYQ